MAADYRHYSDVADWIKKVIKSCETDEQIESAERLIQNYKRLYYDTGKVGNLAYEYLRTVFSETLGRQEAQIFLKKLNKI